MNIPGTRINEDEVVITSPFPRGGDGLFLRAQLISKIGGSPTGNITIDVETRNTEDTWTGTSIGTLSMDITDAAGTVTELHLPSSTGASGLEEELRLKISGASLSSGAWGLIRVFRPLFYDTAVT